VKEARLTLALDLEDTLITPIISATNDPDAPLGTYWPRAGLRDFLEWAGERFDLVVYTGVPQPKARKVLHELSAKGTAPEWFAEVPVFVARDGAGNEQPPSVEAALAGAAEDERVKDLKRVGPLGTVILLDDNPWTYVPKEQRQFCVVIDQIYEPGEADTALMEARQRILDLAVALREQSSV
jgi:hypothetical protein